MSMEMKQHLFGIILPYDHLHHTEITIHHTEITIHRFSNCTFTKLAVHEFIPIYYEW
jgi:hypothetical protein